MIDPHKVSLAQAANLSGIPVEEIHTRIYRGELPGEGNLAMPGNRTAGFVNGETLDRLCAEGKVRQSAAVPYAESGTRFHVYREMPIEQAAAELGMTVREVEVLLVNQELEGAFCFPRWVGVRHESLASFLGKRLLAATPDLRREPVTSPAAEMVSGFRAVIQAFTERRRTK